MDTTLSGTDLHKLTSIYVKYSEESAPLTGDTLEKAKKTTSAFYYVIGVVDSLLVQRVICVTETTATEQLIAVVHKYLEENPALWDENAAYLIRSALVVPFACKAQ